MTVLIVTTVVSENPQGESRGGVYLVDLDKEQISQPLQRSQAHVDGWASAWPRGLHGIAFDADKIYIAASDELLVYDEQFTLLASYKNRFLRNCQEIAIHKRRLFLTSAGFDSILGFDLDTHNFTFGLRIGRASRNFLGAPFDPNSHKGPLAGDELHINSVYCDDDGMFLSGLNTGGLLRFDGKNIGVVTKLPRGVHNARPYKNGVLFNDTQGDVMRYVSKDKSIAFNYPVYESNKLVHRESNSQAMRQGYGRGLCVVGDDLVATGSSPSTVSIHNLKTVKTTRTVTLTLDVRNEIHGLEVWPY